jgi:hypothetical protein
MLLLGMSTFSCTIAYDFFLKMHACFQKLTVVGFLLYGCITNAFSKMNGCWLFVIRMHYELIPLLKCIILKLFTRLICEITIMPSGDVFLENRSMIFMKGYFNATFNKNLFSCPSYGKLTLCFFVLLFGSRHCEL